MTRLRRAVPALVALIGLAAVPAVAKVKHVRPVVHHHRSMAVPGPVAFPTYIDRGSDYNPGGDNEYFSDTKTPNYLVGPGYFQRWDCNYIGGAGNCGP